MRRSDRAVTEPAALFDILTRCRVARLGLCRGGVPYVVPMNFACERQDGRFVFYVHCAGEGQKLDILRENANVCVETDCDHALVPGEQACSHSFRYASVIAQGRAEVLQDAEEKARALTLLMRWQTGKDIPVTPEQANKVTVLRIIAEEITGKQHL